MRATAIATSIAISALALGCVASEDAPNNAGQLPKRFIKIGRIPRGALPALEKRDDSKTTDGGNSNNSNNNNNNNSNNGTQNSPTPTPTQNTKTTVTSPSPTSNNSNNSAKSTNQPSSSAKGSGKSSTKGEQGSLGSDHEASDKSDGGGDKNQGGDNSSQAGDVVNDGDGNPIITNDKVSKWDLITPTGVSYLSGAGRPVLNAAVAMGAIGVVAAGALF